MQNILLPIDNIYQQNNASCWLSVTAQIIKWHTGRDVMLKQLLEHDRGHSEPEGGSLERIKSLLKTYANLSSAIMKSSDIGFMVDCIVLDKTPVIIEVFNNSINHAVLLRGVITTIDNSATNYIINDPLRMDGISMCVPQCNINSSLVRFLHLG